MLWVIPRRRYGILSTHSSIYCLNSQAIVQSSAHPTYTSTLTCFRQCHDLFSRTKKKKNKRQIIRHMLDVRLCSCGESWTDLQQQLLFFFFESLLPQSTFCPFVWCERACGRCSSISPAEHKECWVLPSMGVAAGSRRAIFSIYTVPIYLMGLWSHSWPNNAFQSSSFLTGCIWLNRCSLRISSALLKPVSKRLAVGGWNR